jgi:hypothetical protein
MRGNQAPGKQVNQEDTSSRRIMVRQSGQAGQPKNGQVPIQSAIKN